MIDERIDRTSLTVTSHTNAAADDIEFWMAKTPTERIEGVEYLRRWLYGDDQVDAPVLKVLTFANLRDL